ncbi:AdoMet-homocysteine methyltransferase [Thelotrema lepadinum]|nr:AdoMet-homocysteine methyltransferase [Thelotrema lepadinum]
MPPSQPPILLLDGGLGTTLTSPPYNTVYSGTTPTWSSHLLLSSPQTLSSAHNAFATAGADIISTATYQASFEGFARTPRLPAYRNSEFDKDGYGPAETSGILRGSIPLAAQRSQDSGGIRKAKVALALGPYGATLEPSSDYVGVPSYSAHMRSVDALETWHARRLDIFASHKETWDGVEYVAFETMVSAEEITAVRRAMESVFPPTEGGGKEGEREGEGEGEGKKKWWISTVVPEELDERGEWEGRVRGVVEAMLRDGEGRGRRPWGVGVNCTAVHKVERVVGVMGSVVREMGLVGEVWLVVYPDGTMGEVYDAERREWVADEREGMGGDEEGGRRWKAWEDEVMSAVAAARESGTWAGIVVGGCCKTGPAEIGRLRRKIDEYQAAVG